MNIVLEYIKYRWNAKYLHGVHSPFVYDFMKNAMGIKIKEQHQEEREGTEKRKDKKRIY